MTISISCLWCRRRLRSFFSTYLIEIIYSLQTLYGCLAYTIGQYIYDYYLHSHIPLSSDNISTNFTLITTLSSSQLHKQCPQTEYSAIQQEFAQKKSSNLFFWQNLLSSPVTIIMTYLLGLYTNQLGRKFVLTLTMVGNCIQYSIWLLIIYFHLSDTYYHVAAVLASLTGGGNVSGFILNLWIVESTVESKRSSRFVQLGALSTIASAIASVTSGYWIEYRGYTDMYWTALFLQLLCIGIIILFMKPKSSTVTSHTTSTSHQKLSDIITVFYPKRRTRKKSLILLLTLFAYIFHVIANLSFGVPFLWYQLNYPFCWSSRQIGYYNTTQSVIWSVLSVVGIELFTMLKWHDSSICCISHLCFIISALWTSYAKYDWHLYIGLFISPFTLYQGTIIYTLISKVLEPNEINDAYTFITETSTILNAFGNSFFNYLYSITVTYSRVFTLYVAAIVAIIPFLLNVCLFFVTKNIPDELDDKVTERKPLLLPDNPLQAPDVTLFVKPVSGPRRNQR
ncbi:unnamed protein product [Didymodactylos carnosus]|uniref:Uncharacterized protein n=1 Tax=Didymodactylos carnosus TaxID=1234261 RepID=A0A813V802_9BILA|nr:unnamed protein product [Didymodactylos carnosus]CAF0909878.1 unnamed protein product [Didymodactylos carnosus]CAF3628696.1 unnamed protein product [Didymodactylos carnosus]CAF3689108.1 unnamed protein product [Didymodactylos carnosus]